MLNAKRLEIAETISDERRRHLVERLCAASSVKVLHLIPIGLCVRFIVQELKVLRCRRCKLEKINGQVYNLLQHLEELDLGDNQVNGGGHFGHIERQRIVYGGCAVLFNNLLIDSTI